MSPPPTAWRLARVGAGLLTLVVLVVSGAYLLVYLYRWEWNRAVVSGIFFLASLVTVGTVRVLEAVRRLERRIDDLDAATRSSQRVAADALRDSGRADAARHFDWLDDPGRLGVFIPVLLGAGVIISALTWILERLAGMVAGATVDRATSGLLAPDLPLGPLVATTTSGPVAPAGTGGPAGARRLAGRTIGIVAAAATVALLIGAAVYVLRDATMSRPDTTSAVGRTSVELEIRRKGRIQDPAPVAEALWVTCRARVTGSDALPSIRTLSSTRVEMVLDTRLGELRRRRFFGCLEDLSLDLVQARVIGFEVTPPLP